VRADPLPIAATLLLGAIATRPSFGDEFTFYHENVMGTSLELRVQAVGEEAAQGAERRALGAIARLTAIFSGHDATSEFRRWQAAPDGARRITAELFEVLAAADRWRIATGGAFDPRAEALSRLWSSCARAGRTPTAAELEQTRSAMAPPPWKLDPLRGTAERTAASPLSLDAIAKGFIVERAAEAARGPGVRGLLLNVGGDLCARGEGPGTIGIAPPWADHESAEPFVVLEVRDRSVATSGSSQRGWPIAGHWYSHILDPRNGQPVEQTQMATVVARSGADADALATALNVLTVEEGLRLVEATEGASCLIVTRDGQVTRSAGWGRHERPRAEFLALADDRAKSVGKGGVAGPASWGDTFELVVNFEINRPTADKGPYRRPYVVIWAENTDGHAVRTICLWVSLGGSGPDRWLPDLARWYRDDPVRSLIERKNMVFTIARPTRPPGKYSVVWDGKDDTGQPLPPGKYTISIETAREHGTHQLIRKPVTIGDQPFAEDLPGNVEIKSASLAYRRKAAAR
jgi:thiamine biosynthesis lipoprotein ApbE